MIKSSTHILVSSEKVQNEMSEMFKTEKTHVLPFGIPFDFQITKKQKRKDFHFRI